MSNKKTYVYLKGEEISLWKKYYLWHKWIKAPHKDYIKTEKRLGINTDYSMGCFWGTQEKDPSETGYILIGTLSEDT
jgi:hypothetical protein